MKKMYFSSGVWSAKTFIIFILLTLLSVQLRAQVAKDGIFLVTQTSAQLPPAVFTISNSLEVGLSGATKISLAGLDKSSAIEKIRNSSPELAEADVINYFAPQSMVEVSVLGDIDSPGKYRVPADFPLAGLNVYHGLYNSALFKANVTLIRGVDQIPVPSDQVND